MSDADKTNTIWNEIRQNVSPNSSNYNSEVEHSQHLQNNHHQHQSDFNHLDQSSYQQQLNHHNNMQSPTQQSLNPTGSYTMLSVGHGSYLKVYHDNNERDEYYDLFSSKPLLQPNVIAPQQQQPEVDNNSYHQNTMNGGGISNSTSMFLNQLVGNLGPQNISGTYSPFGEAQTIPMVPTVTGSMCSGQRDIGGPPPGIPNTIESVFQPPILHTAAPRSHEKFLQDLKNTGGKTSDAAVKKQRIIAEVKPMRMSYSDVLSQNVSLNNPATISPTATNPSTPVQSGNVVAGPNAQTPLRTQQSNAKSNAGHNTSAPSDRRVNDENESGKGSQSASGGGATSKKSSNTFSNKYGVSDQMVGGERKTDGDSRETTTNKTVTQKSAKPKNNKNNKKEAKRSGGNASFRSGEMFSVQYEAAKKRPNQDEDEPDPDDDEYDDEDEDDGNFDGNETGRGYYNVMKNLNGNPNIEKISNKPQKRYNKGSATTPSAGLSGSGGGNGGGSRSSKRNTDKSSSNGGGGGRRSIQKCNRNHKYIFIRNFFEKWLEVMVKLITWLTALVSDVVVLSFSIVWDYCKAGSLYAYRLVTSFRNDLKRNPDISLNWFKRVYKRFDQKFSKTSKIAFWRHLFSKKKVPESTTNADFYNNDRLPQTGDEAMYSLLNCKGKDAYSILGVPADCSQEQVRKHYKKIAVLVHPDKNKQPGAEEAFKILQRAFELIGEPETRKSYDLSVAEALNAEKAWSELNDLLAQLQTKIAESANTIR